MHKIFQIPIEEEDAVEYFWTNKKIYLTKSLIKVIEHSKKEFPVIDFYSPTIYIISELF